MTLLPLKEAIEQRFQQLCAEAGRRGIIGFVSVGAVRLLPVQAKYLQYKLRSLGRLEDVMAVSLGLFYQKQEILAVPPSWRAELAADDRWNDYARAYQTLNRLLNQFVDALAEVLYPSKRGTKVIQMLNKLKKVASRLGLQDMLGMCHLLYSILDFIPDDKKLVHRTNATEIFEKLSDELPPTLKESFQRHPFRKAAYYHHV